MTLHWSAMTGLAGLRAMVQSGVTSEAKPIALFLELRESPAITTMIGVQSERIHGVTTIPQVRALIYPTFLIGGYGVVGISMNLIIITMMNWKQIVVRHWNSQFTSRPTSSKYTNTT